MEAAADGDEAGDGVALAVRSLRQHVDIRDRRDRGGKVYRRCFVGSEAVAFFLTSGYAPTERDAEDGIGLQLVQLGYVEHVRGAHDRIKDADLLYRFVCDAARASLWRRGTRQSSMRASREQSTSSVESLPAGQSVLRRPAYVRGPYMPADLCDIVDASWRRAIARRGPRDQTPLSDFGDKWYSRFIELNPQNTQYAGTSFIEQARSFVSMVGFLVKELRTIGKARGGEVAGAGAGAGEMRAG